MFLPDNSTLRKTESQARRHELIDVMCFWVMLSVLLDCLDVTFMSFAVVLIMMTSPNGNYFRITGPLCGEFTGPCEFPTQRPVTRSFDVFFDLRPNKRLSKQPWGWWFEPLSWSLWRHCYVILFVSALGYVLFYVSRYHCPACRTTLVATRFRVAVICPIIQVPHCIRVFFYFVWFVFINHIFQFYYELCTYCNILDIYLS